MVNCNQLGNMSRRAGGDFPVWLRKLSIYTGLEPFLSHTEKL